jgi:septum site-determining protein MinD
MGASIVITSGKGGTGKTTVTAGLGACLAALGKKVICVDADAGARNLDIALGMSHALTSARDLADALREPDAPGPAMTEHPSVPGLQLIPAPLTRALDELEADNFGLLIETLECRADFVLVDCCAGLERGFRATTAACRRAIVVSTAEKPSLRVAARAAGLLPPERRAFLIVNRVNPRMIKSRYAPNVDDMMDEVGLPLLGLVPEDEMVPAAAHLGLAPTLTGGTGAAAAFLRIARRLTGENIPLGRLKRWQIANN